MLYVFLFTNLGDLCGEYFFSSKNEKILLGLLFLNDEYTEDT